jgi:addiction module RelE/StbE family toxin
MEIYYHKHFEKQYRKLPGKIQEEFKNRLSAFIDNPFDLELNNHSLGGKYAGRRSINITGDLRAVYEIRENRAYFLLIGTHSELYS